MAKGRQYPADDERRRTRRVIVAMGVAAALTAGVLVLAWGPWRTGNDAHHGSDHEHLEAQHGGELASLGSHEPHDHAEAVLEPGGMIALYTLDAEAKAARPVGVQVVTAWARAEGGEEAEKVVLVPMPTPDDGAGATSRFKGRLPERLWGRRLRLTVPDLAVGTARFKPEFDALESPASASEHREEERRLYLTPGGRYTRADIEANGVKTPREKFGDAAAGHDLEPRRGSWVCPVASACSTPGFSWVIGGQPYRFCCPPCIGEFVRLAKDAPDRVRKPEEYVKR